MAPLVIATIASASAKDHNVVMTTEGPQGMVGPYVIEQYKIGELLRAVSLPFWEARYTRLTDYCVVVGGADDPENRDRLFPARRIAQRENVTQRVRLSDGRTVEVTGPYFQLFGISDEALIAVIPAGDANVSQVAFVWKERKLRRSRR